MLQVVRVITPEKKTVALIALIRGRRPLHMRTYARTYVHVFFAERKRPICISSPLRESTARHKMTVN